MKDYITVEEAAKKWRLTPRSIQLLCKDGQLTGAIKQVGIWLVPANTPKPEKRRKIKSNGRLGALNVLSLFSGCGGMDLGFEGGFDVLSSSVNYTLHPNWTTPSEKNASWVHLKRTKFHTIFANDIKEDAQIAWTNYFRKRGIAGSTYYLDSIVDLVKLSKKNGLSIFPKRVDVVTGGFPCQDFSVAGKRKGFDSDKSHTGKKISKDDAPSIESRGQLYMWMREVVNLTEPNIFIAENVKGLTNLSNVKEIIEDDFRSIANDGYLVVSARVLHAANYGVPQSRERVFFIGFKKSALTNDAIAALSKEIIPPEFDPYPEPTHSFNVTGTHLREPVTSREAFVGLDEPHESSDLSQQKYSKAKYMGRHCQGQTEVNLYGIAPTIRSEHHGNIEFRRLSLEHGGKYSDELNAGLGERRLTIRECARIQTFPDDYAFVIPKSGKSKGVSASDAYKIIGNAVPPLLAYNLARKIEKNWSLYFGKE